MIKHKTYYSNVEYNRVHDEKVQIFLDELSMHEHTFISINTAFYGNSGYLNHMRTEIVYRENPTRKVITEKTKIENGD